MIGYILLVTNPKTEPLFFIVSKYIESENQQHAIVNCIFK